MCSALRCWRLYSWMRFTCTSNSHDGSSGDAGHVAHVAGQPLLVRALRGPPRLTEGGVFGEGLELAQLVELDDPVRPDALGDERAQGRVREREEPPRRDAVGLVAEALRPHLVEVAKHARLEQLGVQRGDAVDRVAAHRGEMGHADALLAGLADERHACRAGLVAREALAHLVEEARVDLVDDLEVSRQQVVEHRQRPRLERLGQQRVVGVPEASGR